MDTYEWSYGASTVRFESSSLSSKVRHWNDAGNNLNVTEQGPDGSTFTVGSTKTELLAAQGNPTSMDTYEWSYGASTVRFESSSLSSKVRHWNDAGNNLNVTEQGSDGSTFTVGSTKTELLAAQGNPTSMDTYEWSYGASTVRFESSSLSSKVSSWVNSGGNLNLQ
jgi:hypothetical protein